VKDGCVFCGILKLRQVPILYEDKHCFAFYDKKKKSAKEHILMCPKDHIKNIQTVTERDITLLKHIQNSGETLLKQMFPKDKYRY
jgi:diadenosine tetraphosphate (Ap4A) HIT family hydrolase